MKIQEQDIYHGPVLMQIVEHPSFKALNRASKAYGHYLVNTDRQIFTKYRKNKRSPWQFTFQSDELRALSKAVASGDTVLVCLVCGQNTICALNAAEFEEVVALDAEAQQSLRVAVPSGGSCHIRGSNGKLSHAVPHNAFPNKVFA